jgi:O-antigen ligase
VASLTAPWPRLQPRPAPAPLAPSASAPAVHVNGLVRWALYAMVFSIAFELPQRETLPFEVPTLVAAIFLLTTALQPRVAYGRIPAAVGWFFAYLYVVVLAAVVQHTAYGSELLKFFLVLLQGILVLWSAANLMRNETVARGVWISLGLACGALALLSIAGVGRTAHLQYTGGERLTVFGQNANNTAMILSAGFVALGGLAYVLHPSWPRRRWLVWPVAGAIGMAMIETGSRGGLLSVAAGLLVLMLSGRTGWLRVRNIAVGTIAIGALLWASYSSTLMRNRLEQTAEQGNLAGRERIFPELLRMFRERPLIGWGAITNKYELGLRLHEIRFPRRDAHNMVLEVLTSTGVLGTVPFLVGVGLCALAAWRARRRLHGILPLALVAVVLAANMSGNRIASKVFWVVFAYAMAAATYPAEPSRQTVRIR